MPGDDLLALIVSIYEAVLAPERWHGVEATLLGMLEFHPGLRPHLAIAARIRDRLSTLHSNLEAREVLIGRLPYGLFWLDGAGQVLTTNAAGEQILACRDALITHGPGKRIATCVVPEELEHSIARALRGRQGRKR